MINKNDSPLKITRRENYLMSLINKLIREYKEWLNYFHIKPFKIVDILSLSPISGETIFAIQMTPKNIVLKLSAAELLRQNYEFNDFSKFHTEMICKASEGKLIEFLKLSDAIPLYKIVGKRFDRQLQHYLFTIEDKEGIRVNKSAEEIANNKHLLSNIDIEDIQDIKFTQGAESILKEKKLLLLAKMKQEKIT